MINIDTDAKNRIINVTMDILDKAVDIENITVRQIAERANVGIGLINYHFKTKDNLLRIVASDVMAKMATSFSTPGSYKDLDPVQKLKTMLKELFNYAEHHSKLMQFVIANDLLHGSMQTPLFLVPVLREIFGESRDEIQLRIISLQIILPIQVTGIRQSVFHLFSGIDLNNESQRNRFLDALVDNLTR